MPRHDWFDDDTMSRDRDRMGRDERSYRGRERGYSDFGGRERDRGAFFGGDRGDWNRGHRDRMGPMSSDYDRDRFRDRDGGRNRPTGGWGGLMGEDMDRSRDRDLDYYRDRDRDRDDRERMSRDNDRRYGSDDYNRGVAMDETDDLIASNKVEGTPVYDRHGDKLGSVHNFMVHKTRGHVVYAVLKHSSGFLGLNERYYPLEWNQLDYDTRLGGYHTDLEEEDLKSFGSFDSEGRWHRSSGDGRSQRGRDSDRDRRDYGRERSMGEPW